MAKKTEIPQHPLILRSQRLMEAFSKSDDERDFHLDTREGFILYVDLDESEENLEKLFQELKDNGDRYVEIPKLSFYEQKKIMEGFIHEKVYDIDVKEKLSDIIQGKQARDNFLEYLYDNLSEFEKWQQFYQERSRIRIIEWLRQNKLHFVFEEDLDLGASVIEKVKESFFEEKGSKEVVAARKAIAQKAKSYYSNEALNPRPKRGRPPKQTQKAELEPTFSSDLYLTVPPSVRTFLFIPDLSGAGAASFSTKFESDDDLFSSKKQDSKDDVLGSLNEKLASLRKISKKWVEEEEEEEDEDEDDFDEEESDFDEETLPPKQTKTTTKKAPIKKKGKR